jgi:hypothetical protein
MDNLAEIVKTAVFWYAGGSEDTITFKMVDAEKEAWGVVIADVPTHTLPTALMVMARIVGEWVVVEADNTDRPLVDKLVAAGVPRERIILAYAGEAAPEVA